MKHRDCQRVKRIAVKNLSPVTSELKLFFKKVKLKNEFLKKTLE